MSKAAQQSEGIIDHVYIGTFFIDHPLRVDHFINSITINMLSKHFDDMTTAPNKG